ncbi:M4 family metallopeptidase [Thermomonospora amylolytica]|uniref:M4 family metallopeptidase n=1 Tax=Thermomonospora amylolytica TaxID=1411117 RepID=UPI000E6CAEA1|nr:M4 family metallopeptidase [Thermomonospora amylolytica]
MRCTILPPHMLEHLADATDDRALREMARRTLVMSATQRVERRVTTVAPAAPSEDFVPNRAVHDARHREQLPGDPVRTEGQDSTGDETVDQAYEWLGVTFDFFERAYRRNSIDGAGLKLVSTVHYGREYANAFWNGRQMVYGDGDGELFLSFTGPLEVTGHELVHGVTQHTAALEYYGQSGALNESVSDVFGSLVKQWHLRQTADEADWIIGAGLLGPDVNGVGLRSMKEPGTAYDDPRLGRDPQPGHMDDYVETYRDNGGVHINSGIPNRAFYLAAAALGGHAWEKAGRIWYDTLTGDAMKPAIEFAAFAAATIDTAGRLYGAGGAEVRAVQKAWSGVGVEP